KNAIFAAQPARTAPVVGDRNDGSKVRDGTLVTGVFIGAAKNIFLHAAEQRRKTCAPAKRDHAESVGLNLRIGRTLLPDWPQGSGDTVPRRPRFSWRARLSPDREVR